MCIYIRGQHLDQLHHLFTSKKTTVLSNCLFMGACINWSNSESQCGISKTSTKELERPFFFLMFPVDFCFVFSFPSAWKRRISDFCVVTWLDDDRHLKRWHSAGFPWWQRLMTWRTGVSSNCGLLILLLAPTQDGALSLPGSCSLLPSSHHSWGSQDNTGDD